MAWQSIARYVAFVSAPSEPNPTSVLSSKSRYNVRTKPVCQWHCCHSSAMIAPLPQHVLVTAGCHSQQATQYKRGNALVRRAAAAAAACTWNSRCTLPQSCCPVQSRSWCYIAPSQHRPSIHRHHCSRCEAPLCLLSARMSDPGRVKTCRARMNAVLKASEHDIRINFYKHPANKTADRRSVLLARFATKP